MNEPALIQDAQKGNLDAFNTLILHYQDSVYNTALRILGDEDQAADAAQEAFISAFKSITSFRGGSFKAWLMRTVPTPATMNCAARSDVPPRRLSRIPMTARRWIPRAGWPTQT